MDSSPKKEWFTAKEVRAALDMADGQFRDYVEKRIFPSGVKRGKKARVWTTEDIEWMIYREKHQARFDPKYDEDPDTGEEE